MASAKARNKGGKTIVETKLKIPAKLKNMMRSALLAGALPGENDGFGDAAQKQAADFILAASMQRKTKAANIIADSFSNAEGKLATRIAIINGNMPFLVDSASALLSGLGIDIVRLIHPILAVERDQSGNLLKLAKPSGKSDETRESFIYIETGRMDAKMRRNIEKVLQEVMRDVRAAVTDWTKLRKKLAANAELIEDAESADLLRWFGDNNFTLLAHEKLSLNGARSERLGLSRVGEAPLLSQASIDLATRIFEKSHEGPLILKANRVSTVHRNVLLDLVVTPIVNKNGKLEAISIIAGLWTSAALGTPVTDVPVLRRGFDKMLQKFGFEADGHAGKAMAHTLTALPHDLLVTFKQDDLEHITLTAMSLTDRPRPKLLAMRSPLGRHVFAFAWVSRDDISTNLRRAILNMVADAAQAHVLGWTISLEDGGLALVRFTLDLPDRTLIVDEAALDAELNLMVRGWEPAVENALTQLSDSKRAAAILQRYGDAFPTNYRSDYAAGEAALDMLALVDMEREHSRITRLYRRDDDGEGTVRLKIYNGGGAMPLSDAVPVLENFGFAVEEERPTPLDSGKLGYIHDFCLHTEGSCCVDEILERAEILQESLSDVLDGKAEDDEFNKLISLASLEPDAVIWMRAGFRYLRQTGLAYGLPTVVAALAAYPQIAADLVELFKALHNPSFKGARIKEAGRLDKKISKQLEQVAAIDDDRILRLFRAIIQATLRTNAFTVKPDEALAFKIESAKVPGLPKPLPWREIWVYSPRVEGVHLRAGPVARGGLRWSDRRDDFRTEILGLMKAQRVKNAVIVPTGAKGGFYPKQLPDMRTDRDAWLAEGTESYRIFIRSLLSITDNIVAGKVKHPDGVVVRDGEDPYFVVAADKGTASFSDVANALAIERGFWLGDAFASGGSVGYDHKAMGITARGGWVSVQRHFKEMGIDVQKEPVTVAGVGDMSGDVFGNGMMLSKAIKLVAAFDHRHIFIDPDPDPAKSWKERKRLFDMERSSWDDYNKKLISKGGGVFSRTAKKVKTTSEIRKLLDIDDTELEPADLMKAIMKSPVQLLWFGGIGTYIKHRNESHGEVGDHANDAIRVNAQDVRAQVIGEGANLGVTQEGRISFALRGGRINTDFIDNSAGVDCSDNEVNIKIALNNEMRSGRLPEKSRNNLLEKMTDEVADIVLENNRLQAQALSVAEAGGACDLPSYVRLIEIFEAQGRLDRVVEGLAANDELLRRASEDKGMTRPELAILLSTAKLAAQDAAEETTLFKDPDFESDLVAAFPKPMQRKHKKAILDHQLRKEIIATKVANRMVNRLGMLHPFELAEEEGCSLALVVEAFAITERLLDMDKIWHQIDFAEMPENTRLQLFHHFAIEIRAHMADVIRNEEKGRMAGKAIATYKPLLKKLSTVRRRLLPDFARKQSEALGSRMIEAGAPEKISEELVKLVQIDGAIGLAAVAGKIDCDVSELTRAFILLGEALGISWAQNEAMRLDPQDPWERLLVASVARDLQAMRLDFLRKKAVRNPVDQTESWLTRNQKNVDQFRQMVGRARRDNTSTPAMLAQISGQARNLLG